MDLNGTKWLICLGAFKKERKVLIEQKYREYPQMWNPWTSPFSLLHSHHFHSSSDYEAGIFQRIHQVGQNSKAICDLQVEYQNRWNPVEEESKNKILDNIY